MTVRRQYNLALGYITMIRGVYIVSVHQDNHSYTAASPLLEGNVLPWSVFFSTPNGISHHLRRAVEEVLQAETRGETRAQ